MTPAAIAAAVELLAELRLPGVRDAPIDDLPPACRPASLADAYALQAALRERLALTLGAPVGWKIGCTTPVMQDYLGIDHPCAGTLYEATTFERHATLRFADYFRLGLECEIAVRVGEAGAGAGSSGRSIDAVMVSVEIVEHRFADFAAAATPSLVADDFFSVGCVFGAPLAPADLPDLARLEGGFLVDARPCGGTGPGASILGHPLAALSWLARHLDDLGTALVPGSLVTLGSVVKTLYPQPGMHVEATFPALGTVTIDVD